MAVIQTGLAYQKEGALSDCQPIVKGNSVIWYTLNGNTLDFYSIPISSPSGFTVKNTVGGISSLFPSEASDLGIGDHVYVWITPEEYDRNYEIEVTISNPDVLSFEITSTSSGMRGYFTGLKSGTALVTICPRYNPDIARTFTFGVDGGSIVGVNWVMLDPNTLELAVGGGTTP